MQLQCFFPYGPYVRVVCTGLEAGGVEPFISAAGRRTGWSVAGCGRPLRRDATNNLYDVAARGPVMPFAAAACLCSNHGRKSVGGLGNTVYQNGGFF